MPNSHLLFGPCEHCIPSSKVRRPSWQLNPRYQERVLPRAFVTPSKKSTKIQLVKFSFFPSFSLILFLPPTLVFCLPNFLGSGEIRQAGLYHCYRCLVLLLESLPELK